MDIRRRRHDEIDGAADWRRRGWQRLHSLLTTTAPLRSAGQRGRSFVLKCVFDSLAMLMETPTPKPENLLVKLSE